MVRDAGDRERPNIYCTSRIAVTISSDNRLPELVILEIDPLLPEQAGKWPGGAVVCSLADWWISVYTANVYEWQLRAPISGHYGSTVDRLNADKSDEQNRSNPVSVTTPK